MKLWHCLIINCLSSAGLGGNEVQEEEKLFLLSCLLFYATLHCGEMTQSAVVRQEPMVQICLQLNVLTLVWLAANLPVPPI